MIRLSDLALPLDHPPEALPAAICERLGIGADELERFAVARRGNDARRKSAIKLVYTLDVAVTDENGNVICYDVSWSDKLYCDWTPAWDGYFYVTVQNMGGSRNSYYLMTN